MTYVLININTDRYLAKDGVSYNEHWINAMRFFTWEQANEYNEENFNGALDIVEN